MPMIQVDISGVWGEISLPDLLTIEKETADAHAALIQRREFPEPELRKLRQAAETIRADSEVCVVLGTGEGPLAARAAIELLQGSNRNLNRKPQLFFAGNSFSTRQWNDLLEGLEGKDVSLIVAGQELETAIAFRGLRWMLERRYGTEEAGQRIYVVTEGGSLGQMAQQAGWQRFPMEAAALLPMAVAGIDLPEVMQGAADAREEYDLRAFENPAWLYASVRNVLYRQGWQVELLECFTPEWCSLERWWQSLFGQAGGAVPVAGALSPVGQKNVFETMLRFAPTEKSYVIGSDWDDLDGLNRLEGKTLDFVEEQAFQAAVEAHGEGGIPVITMDCGALNARKVGELLYFMALSCRISAGIQGKTPLAPEVAQQGGEEAAPLPGRPEGEKSCGEFQN